MLNMLTLFFPPDALVFAAYQEVPSVFPVAMMLIGFLVFVVIAVAWKLTKSAWGADQKQFMQEQARRRNGELEKGSLLRSPTLRFVTSRGTEARVYQADVSGQDERMKTCFETDLSTSVSLRVTPEVRIFGVGTVFGQDVQVGNEEFDRNFVVQGSSEDGVRRLLSSEVQHCLLAVRNEEYSLEIERGTMVLGVGRRLDAAREMDTFIELGLRIMNLMAKV